MARHLLLDLAEMGVPAGTEFLDMISPQYVAELVSWGRLARERRKARCIVSLRRACLARLGSRMGRQATCRLPLRLLCRRDMRIRFLALRQTASRRFCLRA